jgi:putative DNA primase/helicase
MFDLRHIARALGGEVVGRQVLAPGPGHGARDRSLSIRISADAPDGFLAFSHAGDDWQACKDHVRQRLGLRADDWKREAAAPKRTTAHARADDGDDRARKTAVALTVWRDGVDPRGNPAEEYLANRKLVLGDDLAGAVLRWHPRLGAMLGLFRNIRTNEPQAICRTYLDRDARKVERNFLGPVGGAAIKLGNDAGGGDYRRRA